MVPERRERGRWCVYMLPLSKMSIDKTHNSHPDETHKFEPRRIWAALKMRILSTAGPDKDSGQPAVIPDSRFRIPQADWPIQDSGCEIADSRFRIPQAVSPIQVSRFEVEGSRCKIREIPVVRSIQEPVVPAAKLLPQQLQFLLRVTPPALESQRVYEIPACITIAQAILESATALGWGSSSLFRLANNPFGIEYGHGLVVAPAVRAVGGSRMRAIDRWAARLSGEPLACEYGHFDVRTWEIENGCKKFATARFRRFPNLHEAFRVHAELLRTPRYRPAFDVRHDWKQFAERLGPKSSLLDTRHCGYSTNPSYSAELTTLVDAYQLDDSRTVQWYATGIEDSCQHCAAS